MRRKVESMSKRTASSICFHLFFFFFTLFYQAKMDTQQTRKRHDSNHLHKQKLQHKSMVSSFSIWSMDQKLNLGKTPIHL